MSILNPIPQSKDIVIIQRNYANTQYDETHISGSNKIIYIDNSGYINADDSASFYSLYPPPGGSGGTSISASWASQSLSASWANRSISSSITPFNGDRVIKRNDPNFVGINVGGNNIVSFLNNFFFPFIPATISIDSGVIYETGSLQNIITNVIITANDEITYPTSSLKRDGLLITSSNVPPLTFTYTDNNITSDHSYIGYCQTDNSGSPVIISSEIKTVTFLYPFFYGLSSIAGLEGNTLYTSLTKDITSFGNKAYVFNGISTYIYFAYPSSYIDLVHVLDPNLFQVLSSLEYSASVSVTSSGLTNNWNNLYKVYKWKTIADFNGNYQFKFS